jgi:RNA recognition motif-containing protein
MNIYIANIDTAWKDEDLRTLFATYGTVRSAAVAIDAFTDRSRGFGYVDMDDEEQGQLAIQGLHQKEINGKVVTVQVAEPVELRRGSYKVGSGAVSGYRFKKK